MRQGARRAGRLPRGGRPGSAQFSSISGREAARNGQGRYSTTIALGARAGLRRAQAAWPLGRPIRVICPTRPGAADDMLERLLRSV
ncbi:MAG: hypothetical protein EBY30_17545 [Rhodospirillales bacterium]|nr:hypothetical protein [Rhodospirillales bacterium]